MSNLINNTKKRLSKMERGQVLIVVAIAIVGIVAIVGLSLDVGMMFIGNARLRRAVDSAALAAALQFREGYQMSELDGSAREFLRLNGINDPNALVQVCNGPDYSHTIPPDQCPVPPAPALKLVRVVATGNVHLAFLPVVGIDDVRIAATATSETASVDVVLVIDRSESMTYDFPVEPDNMRDPSVCNTGTSGDGYVGNCHPFDEVKRAAVSFVEQMYFPYDRIAVVPFDKSVNPDHILHFSSDLGVISSFIKNLTVFQGAESVSDPTGINSIYSETAPSPLPSRRYDAFGVYWTLDCAQYEAKYDPILEPFYPTNVGDPSPCTTTNIGAGLYTAGTEFTNERQSSLWVVILLTDGVANAGYTIGSDEVTRYFCPESTWENTSVPPKCNDGRSNTRHTPDTSANYDAEDYAYDAADFVAHGQSALLFTIGLGDQVITPSTVDGTNLGEKFLLYAAEHACDPEHPATICPGLYTHATSTELSEVFRKIAEIIAPLLFH